MHFLLVLLGTGLALRLPGLESKVVQIVWILSRQAGTENTLMKGHDTQAFRKSILSDKFFPLLITLLKHREEKSLLFPFYF